MSAIPNPVPSAPAPRAVYAFAAMERQCVLELAKLLREIIHAEAEKEAKRGAK